mmetsp:Transcript_102161/g.218756  ORF Transcript_102161/g.218756 Transcript_102161/m.218756 type:complete len:218 (-) Transcript_102161:468-1121(-)
MRRIMPVISTAVQASRLPMKRWSGSPYSRKAKEPMSTERLWPASRTGCATATPSDESAATVVVTLVAARMAPCASANGKSRRASQRLRTRGCAFSDSPAPTQLSQPNAIIVMTAWAMTIPRDWAQTKEAPCLSAGCNLLIGKLVPPAAPQQIAQTKPIVSSRPPGKEELPRPSDSDSASAPRLRKRNMSRIERPKMPRRRRTKPTKAMPRFEEGSPK